MARFIAWILARLAIAALLASEMAARGRFKEVCIIGAACVIIMGLTALHYRHKYPQMSEGRHAAEDSYHGFRALAIISTTIIQFGVTMMMAKAFTIIAVSTVVWTVFTIILVALVQRKDAFKLSSFDLPIISILSEDGGRA